MKRKLLSKVLLTAFAVTGVLATHQIKVSAAPIKDAQIKLTQPNGQAINCYASGDEFYNYLHDSNGRAIVKDEKTGYYVYGKYVKDKVIPSRERVTEEKSEVLKDIKTDSRVNMGDVKAPMDEIEKQREMLGANKSTQRTKNIGKLNNIVIFIKFSDQDEITRNFSTYDRQFNAQNQASLSNYYKETSYNQLDVNTTFYPKAQGDKVLSYTDSHPRSYYENVSQNQRGPREQSLLKNAVNDVKNQIPKDLNVDSDNDGKVAVGPWDVMDQTNSIPQSMGAYMKMYYGKWINNISEINKPGKYSVKSINNPTDNSYIIKSPNSNSEYFVVEHRKKQGIYESGLPGEGLLLYRINTALKGRGNSSGKDEVYLYRPSGSLNNVGDLSNAALGDNRTSINSNELFLSDGSDSGISLTNISTSGDTTNFNVVINGQAGDEEDKDKDLPFDYKVNFDDSKSLSGDEEITGQCMYGKKINNIELYVNGYKYLDADRSKLSDSENRYKGYDLSESVFKFKVDFSNWYEANYPYKIMATTEDGQRVTLKEGYLRVKKQDTSEALVFKGQFNLGDYETLRGARTLTGECVYKKDISRVKLYVNGYEYVSAKRYAISDSERKYHGYDLSKAGFKFDLDFSRWYNYDYPYKVVAVDSEGIEIIIKEGYLRVRN